MIRLLAFFLPLLLTCSPRLGDESVQPRFYAIDDSQEYPRTALVDRMAATISPYATQLGDAMNRPLAELTENLTLTRPESTLGNYVTDLMAAAAARILPDYETAFAIHNYHGLRVNELRAGELTVGELFELIPFDNKLVLVEISGAEVYQLARHIVDQGGWPVSDAVEIGLADGSIYVRVNGKPIDRTATYYVAAPDYVANGGSGAEMLAGNPQIASERTVRELVIAEAERATGPVKPTLLGDRIKIND